MADIFISYSRRDVGWVERFAAALAQERDWDIWWDHELAAGDRYAQVIENALREVRCVIVVWSQHSVHSHWVRSEATDGLDRNILLPVQIDTSTPPLEFRQLHMANLAGWDGQLDAPAFVRLLNDIAIRLGDTRKPVARPPVMSPPPVTKKPLRWGRYLALGAMVLGLAGGMMFFRQRQAVQARIALASALTARSIALQHQILTRKPEERTAYWWHLRTLDGREELLQQAVLFALEAGRRHRTVEAEAALRASLGLLTRSVIQAERGPGVFAVAFDPTGQFLATGSEMVKLWETNKGQEVSRFPHRDRVMSVAFTADGRLLAAASGAGSVRVWETPTGKEVVRLVHGDSVRAVRFSPDGTRLATASDDTIARLWEWRTGAETARLQHNGAVFALAFSPDGKWLATASADATARVWDAASGQELSQVRIEHPRSSSATSYQHRVVDVIFSPDGTAVAAGGEYGTVRVWEPATGRDLAQLDTAGVEDLAFSADGTWLAAGLKDARARLWEVGSFREVGSVAHLDRVIALAFSPNSQLLATASQDGTAIVWEVPGGREVARMTHRDHVLAVAFSPDGRYLATGAQNGQVGLWLLQPEDWEAEACRRLSRNLTPDEWRLALGREPYRKTCANLP